MKDKFKYPNHKHCNKCGHYYKDKYFKNQCAILDARKNNGEEVQDVCPVDSIQKES